MKILHLEPERYDQDNRSLLESIGEVDYFECTSYTRMLKLLSTKSYEVVFMKLGLRFGQEAFDAGPEVRFLVTPTTGLNHLDEKVAAQLGVKIISLQGETEFLSSIVSTAEHTFALMLALLRKLPYATHSVERGGWNREPFLSPELAGMTLGIVGFGRLGKMMANYAKVFGMQVMVNDIEPSAFTNQDWQNTPLDILLGSADIVSLHLPSNTQTSKFFDAEKFVLMKVGAWLLNTARGELIDEDQLIKSLQSGHLSGAALDVLNGDSIWEKRVPDEHVLVAYAREHDNLLITPHMGGYGAESLRRTRRFIIEKLLNIIKSEKQ